jgi:hypothetical protein
MAGFEVVLTIKDSQPITSRKLKIPYGITFKQLHRIIQIVFGFEAVHQYNFRFNNFDYSIEEIERLDPGLIDSRREPIDNYFESFRKCTYYYGEWVIIIDIEQIDFDEEYAIIETVHGRYNPLEECGNVEEFNRIVDIKRNSLDYDIVKYGFYVDRLKYINRKIVQKKFMLMFRIPFKEVRNRIVKVEIDPNYSLDRFF